MTTQEIQQNIQALEKQGAKPQEIQSWLDTLGSQMQTTTPTPTPQPSFWQKAGQFLKGEITGAPEQNPGILGNIFQSTIGSKGVLGALQLPGKVIGQAGLYKDIQGLSESQTNLANSVTDLIKRKKTTTDPAKLKRYDMAIKNAMATLKDTGLTLDDLQKRTISPQEALATTARAELTLAPFANIGTGAINPQTGEEIMTTLGQKMAQPVEEAFKTQALGQGGFGGVMARVGARAVESAIPSAAFGGVTAFGQEKSAGEVAKTAASYGLSGAVFGALVQSGAETINTVSNFLKQRGLGVQLSKIKVPKGVDPQVFKDTTAQYGLYGSASDVVQKTEAQLSDLNGQLNERINAETLPSGEKMPNVDINNVLDNVKTRIINERGSPEQLGMNRAIDRAITSAEDEIKQAYGNTLDLSQTQALKRASGGLGAYEFGRADPDAPAKAKVWDYIYSELRKTIEDTSGVPSGVQQINAQMGKLQDVQIAAIKALPAQIRAPTLSLGDFIGTLASLHDPYAAALTISNIVSKSPSALVGAGNIIGNAPVASPQGTAYGSMIMSQLLNRMATNQPSQSADITRQRLQQMMNQ